MSEPLACRAGGVDIGAGAAVVHVTAGGITENLPRVLLEGCVVRPGGVGGAASVFRAAGETVFEVEIRAGIRRVVYA